MLIARTLTELRAGLHQLGQVSLVPTMGALHEGHLALLAAARATGGPVAASIFVNPLQFGATEDLSRYPRDEAGDLAKLDAGGCALAWLPEVGTMYPPDAASTITVAGPAARWEGGLRPGHFAGVATVVVKLFGQMQPHTAYFGEKDWQQIQVLRRVVSDFLLPVTIVPVPTVRERDGLALSSRNRFLSPAERELAPLFYSTLQHAAGELAAGARPDEILAQAKKYLVEAGMTPDYLALVDALSLEPLVTTRPPARLLAAVRLGAVRLLDNLAVG
jgi:pantoate--beta-alanine ligase